MTYLPISDEEKVHISPESTPNSFLVGLQNKYGLCETKFSSDRQVDPTVHKTKVPKSAPACALFADIQEGANKKPTQRRFLI